MPNLMPIEVRLPGVFMAYASDDSSRIYSTESEAPDIAEAFYNVRLDDTPWEWISPGPRITRTKVDLTTIRTRVSAPFRAKPGVTVSDAQLPAQLDLLEERLREQLRSLGTLSFPGRISILPYDPSMNGPLEFWSSGEAQHSRTRDLASQDLGLLVAEDCCGPGYEAGLTERGAMGDEASGTRFWPLMGWIGLTTILGAVFSAIGWLYLYFRQEPSQMDQIYGVRHPGKTDEEKAALLDQEIKETKARIERKQAELDRKEKARIEREKAQKERSAASGR